MPLPHHLSCPPRSCIRGPKVVPLFLSLAKCFQQTIIIVIIDDDKLSLSSGLTEHQMDNPNHPLAESGAFPPFFPQILLLGYSLFSETSNRQTVIRTVQCHSTVPSPPLLKNDAIVLRWRESEMPKPKKRSPDDHTATNGYILYSTTFVTACMEGVVSCTCTSTEPIRAAGVIYQFTSYCLSRKATGTGTGTIEVPVQFSMLRTKVAKRGIAR